jgi:cytochrome c553
MRHPQVFLFGPLFLLMAFQASAGEERSYTGIAALAQVCAGCHGEAGQGFGSIPPIAGLSEQEFIRLMKSFRAGIKPATVMDRIARGLRDEDLPALAGFFARH